MVRSLSSSDDGAQRVLVWLNDAHLAESTAMRLRDRGLEVVVAAGPSAALLGQRFSIAIIDLAVERSLELGFTMRAADYADALLYVTPDPAVARELTDRAPGAIVVTSDARDLVGAALTLGMKLTA